MTTELFLGGLTILTLAAFIIVALTTGKQVNQRDTNEFESVKRRSNTPR